MRSIAVISALSIELSSLVAEIRNKRKEQSLGNLPFYSGFLPGIKPKIYFCSFGIGKILASLTTQRIIDAFHPNHIFLIGVCGGALTGIHPGDVIIPQSTVQADFDITCFDYSLGEFHGPDEKNHFRIFHTDDKLIRWSVGKMLPVLQTVLKKHPRILNGQMVSQDIFETKAHSFKSLSNIFDYNGIDMEAAAVNIVSSFNDIPCNVIKSVLDKAGNLDMDFYKTYMSVVCHNSYSVLKAYLQSL